MKPQISALLLATFALGAVAAAQAAPAGPSARAAAALKKNPRTQWIAHYLPDDRYKVAGGVWKYVSTNLDTYYHTPDSPNMLRQPNTGVIGFASARAAEEAGYKPDPRDGTLQQVSGTIEKQQFEKEQQSAMAASNGGKRTFLKPSGKVILGDGRSTLTVPEGWQRLVSDSQSKDGSTFSIDLMMHPASKKAAILFTMTIPNVDVGRELSSGRFASNIKRFGTMANSSGEVSNSGVGKVGDWLGNAQVRRTRWGGLNGVAISPPPGAGTGAGNMLMVGRGNKLFMFQVAGKGKTPANTSTMINSFQAR